MQYPSLTLTDARSVGWNSGSEPSFAGAVGGPDSSDQCPPHLAVLDEVEEWSSFSQPLGSDVDQWESQVVIEGMHCAACALNIEDALRAVPGVQSVQVSAASHRARVVWSAAQVRPSVWMQAVLALGYRVLPAQDALCREARRHESRQALWQWLVAGLCMMQVMMYATPAYVAAPGDLTPQMAQLLRWASWVLTLPVMLFSCRPFFSNAWRDLVHQRVSMDLPVALGMLITFAVSTAGTFDPGGSFGAEVYFDSLTMFVFFLLTGRWLELRLRDRTAGSLDSLMNRLPQSVERRLPDGGFETIAVRRLQVGDVMRVLAGQAFAADGRVIEGETLVDEALLTGESRPLSRACGATVLTGSHNLLAPVLVQVERLGAQTRFAQIVALMASAATTKPALAALADRIARPFLWSVLAAAAAAGVYWWPHDRGHALMIAVAVLVVTCPCALSLATPAAMLAAAGTLARRGVLVRHLGALEQLARVDTVIFDKTGTLTRDTFVLAQQHTRADCTAETALDLATAMAAHSVHPVSRALAAAGRGRAQGVVLTEVQELAGQGLKARVHSGAEVRLGSARFCGCVDQIAVTPGRLIVCLSDAQGWLATFELTESLRQDAIQTVRCLRQAGVEVRVLSGDDAQAVSRLAAQVGIDQFAGGCSPSDKWAALTQAQRSGRCVAMVGDGLNDGPVLAGAHVSFAVGTAVPLAQAHSDLVLLGAGLGEVAQALLLARRTLATVRQNLAWAALYNAVCVPLAVLGWLPAWLAGLGMALSSLLVVLNALRLSTPLKPLEVI